jgi:glyoxylase-like metal-dependent hydrolase (beta-lactamase superfamily II)
MMTGPGTNTYLLGQEEVAVLDPGPDDPRHLQAILHAVSGTIRWILVTHTHRDHSPLARVLARQTGAQLIGLPPPRDGRQDESFTPDRLPLDGEPLELGDLRLTVVHTPGHASNCICYLYDGEGLLFTGDHVLEGVSPVILPPDGDMAEYLGSLKKLAHYDFERIAPGHGGVMGRGKRIVALLHAHRLARENKVLSVLTELGLADLDRLTPAVYDDVAPDRYPWAKLTLEAHLLKLEREAKVRVVGGQWQRNSD